MTAPDIDAAPVNFALYFAGAGLRVLPIRPRGKEPTLLDWPNLATTDQQQIEAWFDREPEANYGILCDGKIAVDIDPRHGGDLWLDDWIHRLPESWRFRTGSGGVHLLFDAPPGIEVGNSVNLAPGVDIRGIGGQIVGPGSIHPNGGQYVIEIGSDDCPLAVAPQWLVDLIRQRSGSNGQAGPEVDLNSGPIPEGARDQTLTRIAGHLVKTLNLEDARAQLHKVNAERCEPPLPDKDVDRIVDSIAKREIRHHSNSNKPLPAQEPLGDPFGKLPAPPLPRGLLPAIVETYAEHEAHTKGVVIHAPAMAALTVCAATIPDHVRLRVKVHEQWFESARLWTALIGPPSAKKSPVNRSVMAPLKRLEKAEFARWQQVKLEWEKLDKESRGPEPEPKRRILSDTTIEAAGRILAGNPHGMLLERDELSGWFGSMDKYSPGRGTNADRAFWLTAWNGGPYTVDRISRQSLYIENLSVSILGGIQPDAIRRIAAEAVDDGLLQRLIPVHVEANGPGEDSPDLGQTFRDYEDLVHRLSDLPAQTIAFTAEAQEARRAFARHAHELADNLQTLSPQLGAFCGKLDGLFARLALILHCCDLQPPAEHIPVETARRVDRLMRRFIIPHALKFYLDLAGETGILADARSIGGWLLAKRIERFTFGDLTTNVRACRGKGRDDVRRMLEPLEMYGWITPDDFNQPRSWGVSLQVHDRFAERGEQERNRRARVRELISGAMKAESSDKSDCAHEYR